MRWRGRAPGAAWTASKPTIGARSSRSRACVEQAIHGVAGRQVFGPASCTVRFLVELVARYVVVSHVKNIAVNLRNLYWLREMQAGWVARAELLRPARIDAQALVVITGGREIGIPTFVLGGLLIPAAISLWRLASGLAHAEWWIALLVGVGGVLIGLAISWLVLRGAALASRRIRSSTAEPPRASLDDGRARRRPAE